VAALAAVALLVGPACEEHTVAVRFDAGVGDRWVLRSTIETEVVRTIAEERSVERTRSRLRATESVIDVDDAGYDVEVTVARDGADPRTYEVRFDRSGRLSAIGLAGEDPTEALGVPLATDLPADVISPPAGRLEPGERWEIDRRVRLPGRPAPVRVRGAGRIDSLGVEGGRDVARAVVEVVVPVRSQSETPAGRITLVGSQTVTARTAYDLVDGTARRERTTIAGDTDLVVEPPAGVDAPPVPGSLRYDVRTETDRRPAG
jgi:hypothetical protein